MKKTATEDAEEIDAASAPSGINESARITANDFYDLSILSDYGGEVFRHENAGLRQLDLRDVDNNLVHPDRWSSLFRRGTLVMARATLHAFDWENRRVYQLSAQTIRVLRESSFFMELVVKIHEDRIVDDSGSNSAAAQAISSFKIGKRTREE